ncbi:MAG: 2OG-Fe(II) oxygenase [Pseudomonadaceae bacterium]|nr:2OG-Fe(II) oxygenase [Pseudomonadaceae bacterium]HCP57007.1 2OG-Fe(II) oxygenase [Pseudomonas sp.]
MTTDTTDMPFAVIIDDLATQGWSLLPGFASQALTAELAQECRARVKNGALSPARVGRGARQEIREAIRGDQIEWLEPGQSAPTDAYLQLIDGLRLALNQQLFLGLDSYESHFAFYPAGAFYKKHLDRFRDDDRRTVSVVLYLNEQWQDDFGGELRLYLPDGETRDVRPEAGSLVVFMSADMPHEVLPATRERLSLAGWFRRRGADTF